MLAHSWAEETERKAMSLPTESWFTIVVKPGTSGNCCSSWRMMTGLEASMVAVHAAKSAMMASVAAMGRRGDMGLWA